MEVRGPAIGRKEVQRDGENWPSPLIVRFRLKGLEMCEVCWVNKSGEEVKIEFSILSHGEFDVLQPHERGHPLWFQITTVDPLSGQGLPLIPISENGFIEVTFPSSFMEDNPPSFSMRWIDFYR
jgi:hypothetical protein